MSSGVREESNVQEGSIVLNDLESLLSRTLGDEVAVLRLTTSDLLPKGENYASTMLKVDAVIKRGRASAEEELPLVAKMVPISDYQQSRFNITNSFAKEIYAFETLLPAYKDIERSSGAGEHELLDILPRYYGGRLSRGGQLGDKADKDAVLLMENLKMRHYHTMDRMHGMDYEHAKVAIEKLAQFHALGRALRYKRPAFFDEAAKVIDVFPIEMSEDDFQEVATHLHESICTDPRIAKYKDRLKGITTGGWDSIKPSSVLEPWITFIHGDFWVNNIMFKEDNERVTDVKFVDFQLMKVSSPLRDLPYFLCGSVDVETMSGRFDELLDAYYEKFTSVLESMGCAVAPFTRTSFHENLKAEARCELFHCLVAVKFFTFQVSEDFDLNNMKSSIMLSEPSPIFLERAHQIVSKFVEKGWV